MIKCSLCGRWFKNKAALAGHQAHCVGAVRDRKVTEYYDAVIVTLKTEIKDCAEQIKSLRATSLRELELLQKKYSDMIVEMKQMVEMERAEHQKQIEELNALKRKELYTAQLVSQKAARCVIAELFQRINTNLAKKGVCVGLPTSDLEISRYYDDVVKSMSKNS